MDSTCTPDVKPWEVPVPAYSIHQAVAEPAGRGSGHTLHLHGSGLRNRGLCFQANTTRPSLHPSAVNQSD